MIITISLNRELQYNRLSGTIPSSIGSLVNLQYLYAQFAQQVIQLITLTVVD